MSDPKDARLPYDQEDPRRPVRREAERSVRDESWDAQPTEVLAEEHSADGRARPYLEDNRTLPLDSQAFHGLSDGEDPTQVLPGSPSGTSRGDSWSTRPGADAARQFDLGQEADEEPWSATVPLAAAEAPAPARGRDEYGWDDDEFAGGSTVPPVSAAGGAGLGQLGAEQLRGVVLRRQKADYGRLQLIPGFIGWVVGLGTAGLLLAMLRNYGAVFGLEALPDRPADLLGAAGSAPATVLEANGPWLATLGVVYFLAFLVGGFAAGRAARFAGARQGVAVFLWVLMGALVSSTANAVLGVVPQPSAFMVSAQALGGDDVLRGAAMVLCQAVVALVAGILGGLWGTRFHRNADLVGFGLK